jgi:hypothetical protein
MKCRNRGNLNSVLKHLNFWIKTFSNNKLYQIYLYNEDLILPSYFKKFKNIIYLDKKMLIQDYECKFIHTALDKSIISYWWKGTAFALAAPYFYLKEDQYIIQIDSDDLWLDGPALTYIQKAYDYAKDNKLETLSYDMLYSFNGRHAEKRNH